MPELRRDPIVGRWIIIATERAQRPRDLAHPHDPPAPGLCPFCPGQEDKTPREVYVAGRAPSAPPNSPGWRVRVVPNRFPALMIEGDLDREPVGIYDRMNGVGAHEVIIETPHHDKDLGDLSDGDVTELLFAFKARILDLRNDHRFRYILLFKNHGAAAGATLQHAHSQLIALPIVPRHVAAELDNSRRHHEHRDRCIFCDVVLQERKDRVRVVHENDEFLVFAPWASKSPFETWIIPKRHESNFEAEPKERLALCAQALRSTIARLGVALDRPAYNFIVHTNPLRDAPSPSYHWHLELMPALTNVAGFEWGSGFYINPVPPEDAADFLRNVPI